MNELELIVWKDSYGCSPVWEELDESAPLQVMLCESIGRVIRETDEAVLIAPHSTLYKLDAIIMKQYCGDMTIPKCAIVSRSVLQIIKIPEVVNDGCVEAYESTAKSCSP
jgi:hypothetical protein